MAFFDDPKVLAALLTALIVSFISPIVREHLKTKRSRRNLMGMICADVEERVQKFDQFGVSLRAGISLAKRDASFMPVTFDTDGLNDYINWKEEKWLLPTNRASDILKFYNDRAALTATIEFTAGEQFKALSRERQIKVYEYMLSEMESARTVGVKLVMWLKSDSR